MTEYIVLVGSIALIAAGALRVFGSNVSEAVGRESSSIASINTREGSEPGMRSSPGLQSSTSLGSDAERKRKLVGAKNPTLASQDAGAAPPVSLALVLTAIGLAGTLVLLLRAVRSKGSKKRASD